MSKTLPVPQKMREQGTLAQVMQHMGISEDSHMGIVSAKFWPEETLIASGAPFVRNEQNLLNNITPRSNA